MTQRLSDFHYELPVELIAQHPLASRGASRLLALTSGGGGEQMMRSDLLFADLPSLLEPGDLLVFNNTRVMRARLFGHKPTGGRVEILIERLLESHEALAHVRASKAPKVASWIEIAKDTRMQILGREDDLYRVRSEILPLTEIMARHGHVPLPPYITRADDVLDEERYQTLYARHSGAVAAPTAGLHFDEPMLARLSEMGVELAELTLHVGAGTFQPVRVADLDQHRMHAEWAEVDEALCDRIEVARLRGGRIVAVGTTSVRSLETAAASGELRPFRGDTRLFIRPGYRFRVVDAMITNFHLPESTLLMLVAAFAGYDVVMDAYRHAVAERYRFFSFGDAMFLARGAVSGGSPVHEGVLGGGHGARSMGL